VADRDERVVYLDSSALVKLVVRERETQALLAFLSGWPYRASSVLARVEVLRAVRRGGLDAPAQRRAQRLLERLALLALDHTIIAAAALLRPSELRALDALHLASARSLGADLGGVVTYDRRQLQAARRLRLRVFSPG
jgi:predicted nucleic acid-binding protein